MSDHNIDKRKEKRYSAFKGVNYTFCDSAGEAFQGLINNVSKSGLCLHINIVLDKGECISLSEDLDICCQKAILQWTSEIDSGHYLAGFRCC